MPILWATEATFSVFVTEHIPPVAGTQLEQAGER